MHIIALLTSIKQGLIKSLPPTIGECIWALKAKKYDEDKPHFNQAMTVKYAIEYKAAMEVEVEALQRVKTWTQMHNPTTYLGFKLKHYPNGSPQKFKAQLCICRDLQTEGVDYFNKYAPVVSWSMVRMLLTLSARDELKMCLVDFTNVFTQAHLKEQAYVGLPKMFDSPNGPDTILKLNKSLYGLIQALLSWYNHLTKGLEDTGNKGKTWADQFL